MIELRNVSKKIGDRYILKDISCTIQRGTLVSLIGPNGAGKSTLVRIILGFDAQHDGSVYIADTTSIQYIPQIDPGRAKTNPLSVKEFLLVAASPLYTGKKKPSREELEQAVEHVGLSVDILSQKLSTLSGGEIQRAAIARALLTDPRVLILDEPLAAVDYSSRDGLYNLLHHLQEEHDMTMLLVSHDIQSVLPISDEVLCLNTTLRDQCHIQEQTQGNNIRIHHHC